jgi:hypothetical protein
MNTHRANIISILQLISSPAEQSEYQRRVPWVNVANELVNQWFDDFYHPGSSQFEAAFSSGELAVLGHFHRAFDERVDALPGDLSLLPMSQTWSEVSALAAVTLDRLGWTGIVATYDD